MLSLLTLLVGTLTGHEFTTTARPGETWEMVADRLAVPARLLPRWNPGLRSPFKGGERVFVSEVHILPRYEGTGIVINAAEGRLYLNRDGVPVMDVVCGVGAPDWPTPLGQFRIQERQEYPTWRPSVALQKKLQVPPVVPPGPANPLGRHWLGLGGGIGIHGAPHWQMPGLSHGCIRLRPPDAARLYAMAPLGTSVQIIHDTLKLARMGGITYAEIHPPRYPLADQALGKWPVLPGQRLDRARVRQAIQERLGLPVRVSP